MTKKILSIDGGGMYGVIPAEVCIAIEDKLQIWQKLLINPLIN